MGLLGGVGKDTVVEAQKAIDDVQADLDKRWAALIALLQGKRIVITIEVEDRTTSAPL